MIDEMTNPVFIAYVEGSDDSTEIEREAVDRLASAIDEIDILVADIGRLTCLLDTHGASDGDPGV